MFYTRKLKGITVLESWFQRPDPNIERKYATHFYQSMAQPVTLKPGEYLLSSRDGMTLNTDLTLTEEELMMRCDRNVRNKIRRAKKDGAQCLHYTAEALHGREDLLRQFDEAYVEMYRSKGRSIPSVFAYMLQLLQADILSISTCSIEDQVVVYHVYIAGDRIARLLYSVSVFRCAEDSVLRNAIGRSNRMLHYEDMLYFKGLGYTGYDWGGYAMDPALEGINAFKRGFGGEVQPRYYALKTKSKGLYLAYLLLKFIKRVKGT